jgi:hypothetical protein
VTDVNNFFYGDCRMPDAKYDAILEKLEIIIMQREELYAIINAMPAQMTKIKDEINGKIADLEAALAQMDVVPDDVAASIDALKSSADALDGIVPDAVVEETTPVDTPSDVEPV